jgi:hypothetical protein
VKLHGAREEPKPLFPQGYFCECSERFDRMRFIPYTSVFVREAFTLSGTAPACLESFSWKGNIFGPGTL